MDYVISFLLTFIVVYLVYFIFVVKRKKSKEKLKNSLEVRYLINRYHIDIEKINQKQLANRIAICNSLIISIVFLVILFIKNFMLQMLVGFVVLFPVILIIYHILAKSLLKKEGK